MSGGAGGGFLSRWARRKAGGGKPDPAAPAEGAGQPAGPGARAAATAAGGAEARAAPAASGAPGPLAPLGTADGLAASDTAGGLAASGAPPSGPLERADLPALSEAEVAALPDPAGMRDADELALYLRRGVPLALKLAALRRAWTLNPTIRDHLDDAREYAYDWNVPGGVPGSGPIAPGTDLQAAARRILDGPAAPERAESEPDPAGPEARRPAQTDPSDPAPGTRAEIEPMTGPGNAPEIDSGLDPDARPGSGPASGETPGPAPATAAGPDTKRAGAAPLPRPAAAPRPPRRHGGALPI